MPEKITLSGVPETMLQTLYARARESQPFSVSQLADDGTDSDISFIQCCSLFPTTFGSNEPVSSKLMKPSS